MGEVEEDQGLVVELGLTMWSCLQDRRVGEGEEEEVAGLERLGPGEEELGEVGWEVLEEGFVLRDSRLDSLSSKAG